MRSQTTTTITITTTNTAKGRNTEIKSQLEILHPLFYNWQMRHREPLISLWLKRLLPKGRRQKTWSNLLVNMISTYFLNRTIIFARKKGLYNRICSLMDVPGWLLFITHFVNKYRMWIYEVWVLGQGHKSYEILWEY